MQVRFYIESAATRREEIGNPAYPPARSKLKEHGIDCTRKTAHQLQASDYDKFDLLIGVDQEHLWGVYCICGGDYEGKVHLLLDYTDRPSDVADPWYTGDVETAWRDVEAGCRGFLAELTGGKV